MFRPYRYIKDESKKVENPSEIVINLPKPKFPAAAIRKGVSVLLVVGGVFLIGNQIVMPWLATPPAQEPLLKPLAPQVLAEANTIVEFEFEFSELQQPSESGVVGSRMGTVPNYVVPTVFYISIPKLGIERAEVDTNSESLSPDERLGHYPGSALPGEVGNSFIYGHSVLPMFYDPKNYRTIFSTLDKLEKGDKVAVEFGERVFEYEVESWVTLNPEDVKPLEPIAPTFLRESYLTLMTCIPMGVGTNRLLVQAKLVL